MLPKHTLTICAAAAAAIFTGTASADFITFDKDNRETGAGEFHGFVDYFAGAPNHGMLTITLTNSSDPDNGGFITGFVFNINSDDSSASATLTSASYAFDGVANHAAPPFGHSFSAGAALGGNWAGGGNPNDGIGVGESGTFVFDVFASDAATLSPGSFLSGPYDFNFVVRFRGFDDGGSDKVPGTTLPIPGPATFGLLAIGALAGRKRRRIG